MEYIIHLSKWSVAFIAAKFLRMQTYYLITADVWNKHVYMILGMIHLR
jgi:hypothetical protein